VTVPRHDVQQYKYNAPALWLYNSSKAKEVPIFDAALIHQCSSL